MGSRGPTASSAGPWGILPPRPRGLDCSPEARGPPSDSPSLPPIGPVHPGTGAVGVGGGREVIIGSEAQQNRAMEYSKTAPPPPFTSAGRITDGFYSLAPPPRTLHILTGFEGCVPPVVPLGLCPAGRPRQCSSSLSPIRSPH